MLPLILKVCLKMTKINREKEVPIEVLHKYFLYNPSTGALTWKISPAQCIKPDKVVGSINKLSGYRLLSFNKKTYRSHRIIWALMTGYWPSNNIDHINLNRADNRWVNLREATAQENMRNKKSAKNSSSHYKGVCWHKRDKIWQSVLRIGGKNLHLGYFQNEADAAKAYNEKAKTLFGEFVNLNLVEEVYYTTSEGVV